jgi:hypothetical protein
MKSRLVLASTWLATDPRRVKMLIAGVAAFMMLIGLGTGYEEALAGKATSGPH